MALLPFLGARIPDYTPFQYVIKDISYHGAMIALPSWVIKKESLAVGDMVDFNLPFQFDGKKYSRGKVAWARWDEEKSSQLCGVRVDQAAPAYDPVHLAFENADFSCSADTCGDDKFFLAKLLNDTVLLKRGILIYLKHLAPIVPRIADIVKDDFKEICVFLCQDIKNRIKNNIKTIEHSKEIIESSPARTLISELLDLEELREAMEPEIYIETWNNIFQSKQMEIYLKAIKTLEKRIYYNYNAIVVFYIKSAMIFAKTTLG